MHLIERSTSLQILWKEYFLLALKPFLAPFVASANCRYTFISDDAYIVHGQLKDTPRLICLRRYNPR
jgi:hypothetical protein